MNVGDKVRLVSSGGYSWDGGYHPDVKSYQDAYGIIQKQHTGRESDSLDVALYARSDNRRFSLTTGLRVSGSDGWRFNEKCLEKYESHDVKRTSRDGERLPNGTRVRFLNNGGFKWDGKIPSVKTHNDAFGIIEWFGTTHYKVSLYSRETGERFSLTSCPQPDSWTFGKNEIEEEPCQMLTAPGGESLKYKADTVVAMHRKGNTEPDAVVRGKGNTEPS
jgi:hypothetical protein